MKVKMTLCAVHDFHPQMASTRLLERRNDVLLQSNFRSRVYARTEVSDNSAESSTCSW